MGWLQGPSGDSAGDESLQQPVDMDMDMDMDLGRNFACGRAAGRVELRDRLLMASWNFFELLRLCASSIHLCSLFHGIGVFSSTITCEHT